MHDEEGSSDLEFKRRQYLSAVGALGSVPLIPGELPSLDTSTSYSERMQSDEVDTPPYPDSPFMPGQFAGQYLYSWPKGGWDVASIREEYRTLLQLHLDVFDSAGLGTFYDGKLTRGSNTARALSIASHTGLPATAGRNTSIAENRTDDIQPILEANDWTHPDGSPLESVSGSYAETFDGNDQGIDFSFTTNGIPSVFAPLGLHLMKIAATTRFEQGYSGFFIDKVFNFDGLDFSQWATTAFRDHLDSLSSSRQEELGIEEPANFDVKDYLEANDLTPTSQRDPREDPVFQEYVIHNHLGIQNYVSQLRKTVTEEFPDRFDRQDAAIWANQFTGDLTGPQAVNVYGSPYFDVINTELMPTVNPASDYKYKMLQAVGNFDKPVIVKGTLPAELVDGSDLDPSQYYPNLERFQLAETHANGARLKIPLSPRSVYETDNSITQWIRNDGSVPETLQSFADFTWTHKRFLTDSSPQNQVAIVWSLPDRMYRRLPQWGIGYHESHPGVDSFIGAAKLLRESQIPYTVLVFGHPDLWDDSEQLERLSNHEAVILPDVSCLTDSQHTALAEYLADDGFLIASGSPPNRDGRYEPRDDVNQLFDAEDAAILGTGPAATREQDDTTTGQLTDALSHAGVRSVADSQDSTLAVNIRNQPGPSRTIVHLLNYDYSKQGDTFDQKSELSIEVPNPDHEVGIARYYSEQRTTDLDIQTSKDTVEFTVPQLTDWGFVVLAEEEAALVDTQEAAEAEEKVATLRQQVETAKQEGYDWSPKFTVAETRLEEATTALDVEAYKEALEKASQGISFAEALDQEQPVVGIDLAHGVTFNQDDEESEGSPLDPLRNNISYPDYRIIESWSNEVLDELDVLISPPALSFRGKEYDFSFDTRQAIAEFVETGGSLVVLARGGIAPDVDQLISKFGYGFDGRDIKAQSEGKVVAPVVTDHNLTVGVPEIGISLGTTITEMPENATALAAIPEDNEMWFHEEPPLNERNESEEDVPPEPVYAVSNHGDGTVALLGSWGYLIDPDPLDFWTPVMNNLIYSLSTDQVEARETATDTPSPTETATPTPTDEVATPTETEMADGQETSTKSPGFGILGGLAGLTGAVALARQIKGTTEEDSS